MARKTSRRFTNYSNQNDEQQANEQQSNEWQQPQAKYSSGYENRANNNNNDDDNNDNDSLIADMAQGFIQAQVAMNDKAVSSNNLEIALLLQKVNDQLEEIKRSTPNSAQTSNNSSTMQDSKQQKVTGTTAQDNSTQQAAGDPSKELQTLLKSVLQGQSNNENSESKSSNTQSNNSNKGTGGKSSQNIMAVQTVSQVLAQAQYELANELETSLKKLKQVISESEKIANDISNLLGEETMKKS